MNRSNPTTLDARPVEGASAVTVSSAGSVILRRPVPRTVGHSIVAAAPNHLQWEVMRDLERAMEPFSWLDMVLRCASSLDTSPLPILDGLRRCFPAFKPYLFLRGDVAEWWNNAAHPLTIWRGCYEGLNEVGMCYSQDPLTASVYAKPGHAGRHRAILIEATVLESDYIACRGARGELVILALPERPVITARHVLPLPSDFYLEHTLPLRPLVTSVPVVPPDAIPAPNRSPRGRKQRSDS